MKKKIIQRCLIGATIGLSISYIITVIISAIINNGKYYPTVPRIIGLCDNVINAVIVPTVCTSIYGAVFAGSSVIWEIDSWNLLKQTIVHCITISLTMFPIAYLMYWMPHNFIGIAVYIFIFLAIYFFIWFGQYFSMKKKIEAFNDKVKTTSETSS